MAWFEEREGSGFWAITRHVDIVPVNRSCRRFSSRQGIRLEDWKVPPPESLCTVISTSPGSITEAAPSSGEASCPALTDHGQSIETTVRKC